MLHALADNWCKNRGSCRVSSFSHSSHFHLTWFKRTHRSFALPSSLWFFFLQTLSWEKIGQKAYWHNVDSLFLTWTATPSCTKLKKDPNTHVRLMKFQVIKELWCWNISVIMLMIYILYIYAVVLYITVLRCLCSKRPWWMWPQVSCVENLYDVVYRASCGNVAADSAVMYRWGI